MENIQNHLHYELHLLDATNNRNNPNHNPLIEEMNNMNQKIIIIIIISMVAWISVVGYGKYIYETVPASDLVDPRLENNTIAHEISDEYGIEVTIEELGQDQNGLEVRGQSRFANYVNGTTHCFMVVLDDDIDPNSETAHAILAHELGHIYNEEHGIENNEANADAYANSRGYIITDAYHGVH